MFLNILNELLSGFTPLCISRKRRQDRGAGGGAWDSVRASGPSPPTAALSSLKSCLGLS